MELGQIRVPQTWVDLERSHPSNVPLVTGTHTNDSRSQKNSAQELDFCSVLATCLWFLTTPMSVLPESLLRATSRCWEGFKAASEGLGCRRYLGCPGVSFILQGQLSASTKRSPRVRGQAVLQFVLLQPEHYPPTSPVKPHGLITQCREQPQRQLVPLSCGCPDAGGPVSKQPSCPARSRALWSCQSAGSMATAAPAAGKHLGQQAALCLPAVTCGLPAKTQRLRGCRVRHMDREGSERDAAQ